MILKLPYSYDFKENVYLLIDKSRNLHVIWSEPDGYHIEGRGIFPQEENIKFAKKRAWGVILSINNTFVYPVIEMEDNLYISKNKKFVFDIFNNEIYYIEENTSCFTNYLTIRKIDLNDFFLFNEDNLFTSDDMDDVEEKIIDDTLIVKFQKTKNIKRIVKNIIKHFYSFYSYKKTVILDIGKNFYVKKSVFSNKVVKFEYKGKKESKYDEVYSFESFVKYFFEDIINNNKNNFEKWFDVRLEKKMGINFVFEKYKAYGFIKIGEEIIDYHVKYRRNAYKIIKKEIQKRIVKGIKQKVRDLKTKQISEWIEELRQMDIEELKKIAKEKNISVSYQDSLDAGNCEYGTERFIREIFGVENLEEFKTKKISLYELIKLVEKRKPEYLKQFDFLRLIASKL